MAHRMGIDIKRWRNCNTDIKEKNLLTLFDFPQVDLVFMYFTMHFEFFINNFTSHGIPPLTLLRFLR